MGSGEAGFLGPEAQSTMGYSWWLGLGLGVGVVGLHAVVRRLAHRFARQASDKRTFLLWELGGLGARMMVVLGLVALVLLSVPVCRVTFVATVVFLLLLSLGAEMLFLAR